MKKFSKDEAIILLKERLLDLAHLGSVVGLLNWDQEVNMPKKGVANRASVISLMVNIWHDKLVSIDDDKILTGLKRLLNSNQLNEVESVLVRETLVNYDMETKLPSAFVAEFAKVTSQSQHIWREARAKNNFKLFLPSLKKIISLNRQQAKFLGYKDSPYDALIDIYEPKTTSAQITAIFNDLKEFLIPFIEKINKSKIKIDPKHLNGNFPIAQQETLNRYFAEQLGFDFDAGRVDRSTHPFANGFHPHDVRITTRYDEKNLFYSLSSTMHETGHALYEQGMAIENFGTPMGESVSLGIHESQSRMWENIVGKNINFWRFYYPKLRKAFPKPFANIPLEDFYKCINYVKPSLIRTESDEVTYNLHIIIRFEIEKALIEGTIKPEDLPRIWKEKYKKYLGLDVPNDTLGVLQDSHWSSGSFGYFPTYTLGNLYSTQFFAATKKALPKLEEQFKRGELNTFRDWFKKNIYLHGKYYTADKLVKHITGEPLNPKYFINYLTDKYSEIYNLK